MFFYLIYQGIVRLSELINYKRFHFQFKDKVTFSQRYQLQVGYNRKWFMRGILNFVFVARRKYVNVPKMINLCWCSSLVNQFQVGFYRKRCFARDFVLRAIVRKSIFFFFKQLHTNRRQI